ncbi:ADP-ribosylglycohydrolase family protein [Mesorhizobium caraganae]|uniref:ADP-ribosylglycohydrolase family protein n=1 Tax=Mesorhizobium caraganae TaxID=483206 RepID=A0ABV1YWB7_9HYPH
MADAARKDRALGALVGLAAGDAVGTTLEFVDRDTRPALTDMIGGGPFGLEPGQWTDDTSMALCLADCLIADKGEVEPRHLLAHFVNWWRLGVNSVTGDCFDIGGATSSALRKFELHGTVENNPEDHLQANGSIMRLSPVVLSAKNREQACTMALAQGRTTHAAPVPQECCELLAGYLWDMIETGALPPSVSAKGDRHRRDVVSTGHAPATLDAACWSVATTGDFRSAVLKAANLGDDADTVGAVTGQLAGALYGLSAIPSDWLEKLAWRDDIIGRAEKLWALRGP